MSKIVVTSTISNRCFAWKLFITIFIVQTERSILNSGIWGTLRWKNYRAVDMVAHLLRGFSNRMSRYTRPAKGVRLHTMYIPLRSLVMSSRLRWRDTTKKIIVLSVKVGVLRNDVIGLFSDIRTLRLRTVKLHLQNASVEWMRRFVGISTPNASHFEFLLFMEKEYTEVRRVGGQHTQRR